MRHAFIGLCIFTAACSRLPVFANLRPRVSPVWPPRRRRPTAGAHVEVTFTKWITALSGDGRASRAAMSLARSPATVLGRDPVRQRHDRSARARYEVTVADRGALVRRASSKGRQNNSTHGAVLNGTVYPAGWLVGAQVHVDLRRHRAARPVLPACRRRR